MRRNCSMGFLILLVIVMSGCARIPVRELHDYSDSFNRARAAGELALEDMAAAKAAAEARRAQAAAVQKPVAPYPAEFDPKLVLEAASPKSYTSVLIRRRAFDLIGRYNLMLLELAEGRSVGAVRQELDRFGQQFASLSSLLMTVGVSVNPLVGVSVGALGPVIQAAQRAWTRYEFMRALLDGQPVVDAIAERLIADTVSMYAAHKVLIEGELEQARKDAGDAFREMRQLAAFFRRPPEGSDLAADELATEREMNALLKTIKPDAPEQSLKASFKENGRSYSLDAAKELAARLQKMRDAADRHKQGIARINAYYQTTSDYVVLLDQARHNLALMKAAAESSRNPEADILEAARFGAETYNQIRAIRAGTSPSNPAP